MFKTDEIDHDMLETMAGILKDKYCKAINLYEAESSRYLKQIKEGFSSVDLQSVIESAHPLKSSSASLGLTSVHKISKHIEVELRKLSSSDQCVAHIETLVPCLEQSLEKGWDVLKSMPNYSS